MRLHRPTVLLACLVLTLAPTARAAAAEPANPVPKLLRQLRDPDSFRRSAAARDLGKLGPLADAAAPALIDALKDKDWSARSAAAEALGRVAPGDPPAIRALAAALQDEDRFVRSSAIHALGRMGSAAAPAVRDLVKVLDDADPGNRSFAVGAIRSIGPAAKDAVPALATVARGKDAKLREDAVWALESLGPAAKDAVPALVGLLKERDKDLRRKVLQSLGAIGPGAKDAVPALAALVGDPDVDEYPLGQALRKIGPAAGSALPDLLKALKDKDATTRDRAGYLLGHISGSVKETAPALRELLSDKESTTRAAAVTALRNCGPAARDAVADLADLLPKGDAESRREVVWALGELRPMAGRATVALQAALQDPDRRVRFAAAEALAQVDPTAPGIGAVFVEMLGDGKERERAAETLAQLGPMAREALPATAKRLEDHNPAVRRLASRVLRFGYGPFAREALPALRKALKDENAGVRADVLELLTDMGSAAREATPDLLDLLKATGAKERGPVIRALGAVGGEGASEALVAALATPDRKEAALALKSLGGDGAKEAAKVWLEQLKDEDFIKRRDAVMALGDLGPATPEVAPALIAALKDKDSVVRAAVPSALKRVAVGKDAAPAVLESLLAGLADGDGSTVEVLGEFGADAKAAVPRLKEMLWVEGTRFAAAVALANIDPSAHPKLALVLAAGGLSDETGFHTGDMEALKALAAMGPAAKPAIPAVRRYYQSVFNPFLRMEAVQTLGAIGPDAVPVLAELLDEDPDMLVVIEIARALSPQGDNGKAALPALLAARNNSSVGARRNVLEALGSLGPAARDAVPVLLDDLPYLNPLERGLWARAVLRIDPAQSKKIREALEAERKSVVVFVRLSAIMALLEGDETTRREALDALVAELRSDDLWVRALALFVVGEAGPAARPLASEVAKLRDDKDPVVSKIAAEAMRRLDKDGAPKGKGP